MELDLRCPACLSHVETLEELTMLDRIFGDRACCALGDGETFEDMIHSVLSEHGAMQCTSCGKPIELSEDDLGHLAWTMLSRI
jgi:hypothetical protein